MLSMLVKIQSMIGDESWSWSGWLYAIYASEDTEYNWRTLELAI